MREMRWFGSLLVLSVLASAAGGVADDKTANLTKGTIEQATKGRLGVKTEDGKVVSFVLDTKTVVLRAGKEAAASSLKAGEPVSVEYQTAGAVRTAVKLRVGADTVARYSCPMHPEVVSDKPGKCPQCGMFLEQPKP